jgi:hypothetical protein
MYLIESESKLEYHLEVIDIENNEYIGWDKEGKPIELYLDNGKIRVRSQSEIPEKEKLKEALLNYAKIRNPKKEFKDQGWDVVELFQKVEKHIEDR